MLVQDGENNFWMCLLICAFLDAVPTSVALTQECRYNAQSMQSGARELHDSSENICARTNVLEPWGTWIHPASVVPCMSAHVYKGLQGELYYGGATFLGTSECEDAPGM